MRRIFAILAALSLPCSLLSAQNPAPGDAALAACSRAAGAKQEIPARQAADRAEAEFQSRLRANPADVDARVGLARVISECRMGFASFMAAGRLSGRAIELLQQALRQDSTHWAARYTLAMNFFYMPAFLGRTDDAVREFERLVAQQGDRREPAIFARPHLRLGELYLRQKREDAALAVWRRGSALFPADTALRRVLLERERRTEVNAPDTIPAVAAVPAPARATALDAIVVAASANRMDDATSGTAVKRMDVFMTPGGAADLMQVLQTGPGTTRAQEGADLYVRGGEPAESPVWIDGARLFYAGRYESLHGGAFGVLDPAVLGSATFSSGGFSARFGNALSGVLDVETLGMPDLFAGVVSLNTVSGGAMVQAPITDRFGVWSAARATQGSLMLAMHGRTDEFSTAPRSLEGLAGAVWQPRPGWSLKATALLDDDESARRIDSYGYTGAFRSQGSNRLFNLSGRVLRADGRAGIRASVSTTGRESRFTFGVLDRSREDRGATVRIDGDLLVGPGRVRVGAEAAAYDARHSGTAPDTDQLAPGSPASVLEIGPEGASHLGGYAEWEWSGMGGFGVVAGMRADRLPGESGWTADPRLALAYRTGEWMLRAGGGSFHQGRWRSRYVVPDAGRPSGVPTRARHLVAGVERRGDPAIKVEVFRKEYDGYVAEVAGAEVPSGPAVHGGSASGVDAVLRWSREGRRVNGWLTYSGLRGRVELERGGRVPSATDVTHSATAVAMLRLPRELQLGNTLRYGTGRPYTDRAGGEVGPIHGERMPTYLRLDTRLTRFWSVQGRTLVSYMEMLNSTDRRNVAAYTWDGRTGERGEVTSFFGRRTVVLGAGLNF